MQECLQIGDTPTPFEANDPDATRPITKKYCDERGAAPIYHELGILVREQRDFVEASRWHLKSLAITCSSSSVPPLTAAVLDHEMALRPAWPEHAGVAEAGMAWSL